MTLWPYEVGDIYRFGQAQSSRLSKPACAAFMQLFDAADGRLQATDSVLHAADSIPHAADCLPHVADGVSHAL